MRSRGLVLGLTLVLAAACGGVNEGEITGALTTAVASEQAPQFARDVSWKAVREIYADRRHAPLWVSGKQPQPHARALVEAIAASEAQGLRIGDYDLAGLKGALEAAYRNGGAEPAALAELDIRLTTLFLSYGRDLLAGRLDPKTVDRDWYIRMRAATADSVLRATARSADLVKAIGDLAPGQPDYRALAAELARYRAVQAAGGWVAVKAPLRVGASGPEVLALRSRLAASGDLDSSAVSAPTFDEPLAQTVTRFRQRHGLPAGGGLDAAALKALNVPIAQRIRQLELNLERFRWLPNDFGDRYVFVNVPDFHLRAFDGGKEVLDMRVIVGEEYDQETPVFADTMSYVEFRPYWNVPRSITIEEIAPKVRARSDFLRANNYEIVPVSGKQEPVDPRSVDWNDVEAEDFPYRVRQGPGPTNALGLVKFMFPNRFNIYMHDTPAQHLFHQHRRAMSHGCIRLQHPDRFAEYVLAGVPEWTLERIAEAMQQEETQQVRVKRTLPVYILYLTAFVQDGRVQYRDDLYGTDERALTRLSKPASPEVIGALRETLSGLMKG